MNTSSEGEALKSLKIPNVQWTDGEGLKAKCPAVALECCPVSLPGSEGPTGVLTVFVYETVTPVAFDPKQRVSPVCVARARRRNGHLKNEDSRCEGR
jgi:hypothetical protein